MIDMEYPVEIKNMNVLTTCTGTVILLYKIRKILFGVDASAF